MSQTVYKTDFSDLTPFSQGKVRDIYDLGEAFLMVATDRISAYDVVLPNPIPGKGRVLTEMSTFWFQYTQDLISNHVIATAVEDFPEPCRPYAEILRGRSMLVRKAEPLPVECIVRGYLSGSGWSSYVASQSVCGIALPADLKESDRLPEPVFTPSTKEDVGRHDVNISFDQLKDRIGRKRAVQLQEISIAVYTKCAAMAEDRGIIIADTKFEFGIIDGDLVLIDELLTPDSSRFWPKDAYRPGGPQESFDKQFVRDYLTAINWDKTPPAPNLPHDVVEKTRLKYEEALTRLTGRH